MVILGGPYEHASEAEEADAECTPEELKGLIKINDVQATSSAQYSARTYVASVTLFFVNGEFC